MLGIFSYTLQQTEYFHISKNAIKGLFIIKGLHVRPSHPWIKSFNIVN